MTHPVLPHERQEHGGALWVALHLEPARPVGLPLDLVEEPQLLPGEVLLRAHVEHAVEHPDAHLGVLDAVLLQHGPLHRVHVADRDGLYVRVGWLGCITVVKSVHYYRGV